MKGEHQISPPQTMLRRSFLWASPLFPLAVRPTKRAFSQQRSSASPGQQSRNSQSVEAFLRELTYTREEVAAFLDSNQTNVVRFDPELGYAMRDFVSQDGVDGCRTTSRFSETGERKMISYADRPCRINAYGDSFTQGNQVSDGETWGEYLAAHLGEPIRNFGVGGYGVYQAYRRLLREEATPSKAEYLILNIWGIDDHLRSISAWRWLRVGKWWRVHLGYLYQFSGNPWVHIRPDLDSGQAVEHENPYPTAESLNQLTDEDHVVERFRHDPVVKLIVAERSGTVVDRRLLETLAGQLRVQADFSTPEGISRTARSVHVKYALKASMHIVEKTQAFARKNGKKLMVFLSYDSGAVRRACEGFSREDGEFVRFLRDNNIRFVDTLQKHVEDFRAFRLSPRAYVGRYYIGHYNPLGNHFFAFAVKEAVVDWLDPKPPAYRRGTETIPRHTAW